MISRNMASRTFEPMFEISNFQDQMHWARRTVFSCSERDLIPDLLRMWTKATRTPWNLAKRNGDTWRIYGTWVSKWCLLSRNKGGIGQILRPKSLPEKSCNCTLSILLPRSRIINEASSHYWYGFGRRQPEPEGIQSGFTFADSTLFRMNFLVLTGYSKKQNMNSIRWEKSKQNNEIHNEESSWTSGMKNR
jgi:hypothetical protein